MKRAIHTARSCWRILTCANSTQSSVTWNMLIVYPRIRNMRFLRIAYCELSNGQGANSNSPAPLFFVYYPEYYSGILFPTTSLVLDGVPSRVSCIPRLPIKNPRPVHKEPSEEREGLLMYLHLHHHLLHQLIIGAVLICRCCLSGHDGNNIVS